MHMYTEKNIQIVIFYKKKSDSSINSSKHATNSTNHSFIKLTAEISLDINGN